MCYFYQTCSSYISQSHSSQINLNFRYFSDISQTHSEMGRRTGTSFNLELVHEPRQVSVPRHSLLLYFAKLKFVHFFVASRKPNLLAIYIRIISIIMIFSNIESLIYWKNGPNIGHILAYIGQLGLVLQLSTVCGV